MQAFDIEIKTETGLAHLIVRPIAIKTKTEYEIWNEENLLFIITQNEKDNCFALSEKFAGKQIDQQIVDAVCTEIQTNKEGQKV